MAEFRSMTGELSQRDATYDPSRRRTAALALAALGVVYGDIGTSPLYAIRECFFGAHGVETNRANVLGALSLVFWTLIVVVTLKYHVYVLRADNQGEGGILALMALVRGKLQGWGRRVVLPLGLFGASLLYADGILTPAISVLGALEGLTVVAPGLAGFVVPASVAILVGLFAFQRRGTAGVGAIFGPVMLVWFVAIAVLGIGGILRDPSVLAAVNPLHGARFLAHGGSAGFLVLGAVFLVATGGEALFADLGHFGERPIQIDWFGLVGFALLLNYFGQGALLLSDPAAAANPFFLLAPAGLRLPLLALATAAAIIASQAIISGAFSLTRQAVQLGYLPRVEILHTSAAQIGQVYIGRVNWILALATVAVVVGFGSSSGVAGAYGVAITATMLITTVLAAVVARQVWRWPVAIVALVTAAFLVPDFAFFAASLRKIPDGGWFPIIVALGMLAVMTTWEKGRGILRSLLPGRQIPVDRLIAELEEGRTRRVPGWAVHLTEDDEGVPIGLLHNFKINRVVHEKNLFLTVRTADVPAVPTASRVDLRDLGSGFHRATVLAGFMEDVDLPAILGAPTFRALGLDPIRCCFVLSRSEVVAARRSRLPAWRRRVYLFLKRNATDADRYFRLPPDRVLDIGMVVEI